MMQFQNSDEHEAILDCAVERYRDALTADREERREADEDKRFAIDDHGCQWDQAVRNRREGVNPPRPCLVINKIPEKLDVAEGEFLQLQQAVKVRPVDSDGDPVIADVIAGLLRHIDQISMAEAAYNTAYMDVLYCGRGAWRINVQQTEEDPFLSEIRIGRIPNILSLVWDPDTKEIDRSDAKYCFVTDWLTKKEFKQQYPHIEIEEGWPIEESNMWGSWRTEDGVRIAEYWWRDYYDVTWCRVARLEGDFPVMRTVREEELTPDELETLGPGDRKIVKDYRIRWCKMMAKKIVEGPHDWPGSYLPIIVTTGKEVNIEGRTRSRGMVRFAKTPQRMYNYMSSSMVEQVALAPKAPYLIADDQLGPYKSIWEEAHLNNFVFLPFVISEKNPNFIPKREMPPQLSSGYAYELDKRDHEIMSAMGRYQPALGSVGPERSAVAIQSLQRQGNVGSTPFIKKMQYSMKHSARVLVDLIPHIYDTERVIHILGEDGEEIQVPININTPVHPLMSQMVPQVQQQYVVQGINKYFNDLTIGKYDVVFDIGPSYATMREEILTQLVELTKVAPQLASITMEMIIENMDIPKARKLLEKVDKALQPPAPAPPGPEVMLDMEKFQFEKLSTMHEQMRKDFDSQMKAIKTVAEAESLERGQQLKKYITDMQTLMVMLKTQTERGQQPQASVSIEMMPEVGESSEEG